MDLSKIIKIEPIRKGWSGDRKYRLTYENGVSYFLRLVPRGKEDRLRELFRLEEELFSRGLAMARPIEIGEAEEGCYIIESWISGKSAEEELPKLSYLDQFNYGLEAGDMLRLIHSLPGPADLSSWQQRFNTKIDRKIRMYKDCPLKIEGDGYFLDYIDSNRQLLEDRPQCFQHGDYHVGNMMIEDGRLVIIDFDRFDYGDPWEEFNRIVWSAQASPAFASGLVEGYFKGEIPEEFWRLLALYISSNALSALAWAIDFGEGEIATMKNQAEDILAWYKNMDCFIPSWYNKEK